MGQDSTSRAYRRDPSSPITDRDGEGCSEAERLDEPRLELCFFALVVELALLQLLLELVRGQLIDCGHVHRVTVAARLRRGLPAVVAAQCRQTGERPLQNARIRHVHLQRRDHVGHTHHHDRRVGRRRD